MPKDNIAVRFIHNYLGGSHTFDPHNPNLFVQSVLNKFCVTGHRDPNQNGKIKKTLIDAVLLVHREKLEQSKAPDFFNLIRPLQENAPNNYNLLNIAYNIARNIYLDQFTDNWNEKKRRMVRPPGKALVSDIDNFLTYQILDTIRLVEKISRQQFQLELLEPIARQEAQNKINDLYNELQPLIKYLPPNVLETGNAIHPHVKMKIETIIQGERQNLLFANGDPGLAGLLVKLDITLIIALVLKDTYLCAIKHARDSYNVKTLAAERTKIGIASAVRNADHAFMHDLELRLKDLQNPEHATALTKQVTDWLKHPALDADPYNIPPARVRQNSLADYLWDVGQKNLTTRDWKKLLVRESENSDLCVEEIIVEFLTLQAVLQRNKATSHVTLGLEVAPVKSRKRIEEKLTTTKTPETITDHRPRFTFTVKNLDDLLKVREIFDANEAFIPQSLEHKISEDIKEMGYGYVYSFKLSKPTGEIGTTDETFELKISLQCTHDAQVPYGDPSYRVARSTRAYIKEERNSCAVSKTEHKSRNDFLDTIESRISSGIDRVSRWAFDIMYFNAGVIGNVKNDNKFALELSHNGCYEEPDRIHFLYLMAKEVVTEVNGKGNQYSDKILGRFFDLCHEELDNFFEKIAEPVKSSSVKKGKKQPEISTYGSTSQQSLCVMHAKIMDYAEKKSGFLSADGKQLIQQEHATMFPPKQRKNDISISRNLIQPGH